MPLAGEICSQLPPESVVAAAVQLKEPCPVLRMPKFCGSGTPPCATAVKLKAVCESRMMAAGALIDKVTGNVDGLARAGDVTVPE